MSLLQTSSVPMTIRARLYLGVTAAQHWGLAFSLYLFADLFAASAFDTVRDISEGDIRWWAVAFVITALLCGLAALSGSEMVARVGLTLSAMLTGAWAIAFVITAIGGGAVSPSAYIVWPTLVLKDLIVGYYPLTSPLEPLLAKVRHKPSAAA